MCSVKITDTTYKGNIYPVYRVYRLRQGIKGVNWGYGGVANSRKKNKTRFMNDSIRIKLIIGLILTIFCACTNKSSQSSQSSQKDSIVLKRKYPNYFHEPIIDKSLLLSDEKLPVLIAEIEKRNLKEKKKANEIPNFIRKTLNRMTADNFSIADCGEKWQVTDDVVEELPARQLVYLGLGDNITLIAYFSGGIGESEHILIIKHKNQQVTGLWHSNILHDFKTKKEILKFLKKNIGNKSEFNSYSTYY